MAADRPAPTVADYVTTVLSPALIMGLVASLVFFLLEVFYKTDGEYKGRMQWILFFFVFGAVLTARVAIVVDSARATLYGLVLAFLTWIGLQQFIDYPEESGVAGVAWLINLFLVGIVWWCAKRLTWDCTHVDEEAEPPGEGLLRASGLEAGPSEAEAPPPEQPTDKAKRKPSGLVAWVERYRKYREERARKRPLGVWVVYFSLAALPLFGLGQALLPIEDAERRQFSFWLMTVYVGCGLGLLLTTCFLGLRRYLRQRKVQMPAAMTSVWMLTGGGLVLALLLTGAVLPRPHAEYTLLDPLGAAKRKASRFAVKGDSPGQGEGRPGEARRDGQQPGNQQAEKGERGEKSGKGSKQGGEKDGENRGEKGNEKGREKGGDKGAEKGGDSGDKSGEKEDRKGDPADKSRQGKDKRQGSEGQKNEKDSRTEKDPDPAEKDAAKSQSGSSSRRFSGLMEMFQKLGPILKVLIFILLGVVVFLFVARGFLGFLAGFTDWARRWLDAWHRFWANLFARRPAEERSGEGEGEARESRPRFRTFAEYANPFANGSAARMSPRELVLYTFEAVEAWAREHDLAREPGETALEFSSRLGNEVPGLEEDLRKLSALLGRAVYARGGKLPANTQELVRAFWERLERVVAAPLSA